MHVTRAAGLWISGGVIVTAAATATVVWPAASAIRGPANAASDTKTLGGGAVSAGSSGNGNGNNGNGPSGGSPGKALSVKATIPDGVVPGETVLATLLVTNPNSQRVKVTAVTGSVTGVSPSTCSAGWFTFGPSATLPEIGPRSTTPIAVDVTLRDTGANQDVCKTAKYTYSFTVSATQA